LVPNNHSFGVMVLSVIEDNWAGGAGNLLGTPNAYIEASKQAKEDYGVNLDQLFRANQVKIRHIPNGGRAKRCNGLKSGRKLKPRFLKDVWRCSDTGWANTI